LKEKVSVLIVNVREEKWKLLSPIAPDKTKYSV
jgi:hypothetical protein